MTLAKLELEVVVLKVASEGVIVAVNNCFPETGGFQVQFAT
jgi:hypothetical protein